MALGRATMVSSFPSTPGTTLGTFGSTGPRIRVVSSTAFFTSPMEPMTGALKVSESPIGPFSRCTMAPTIRVLFGAY